MAVALPLALGALGASTAVSVGVGLAVAATGIGSKIDKAASKVFGKDLVKVANIAGAAYMGYQAMGGASAFGSSAANAAGGPVFNNPVSPDWSGSFDPGAATPSAPLLTPSMPSSAPSAGSTVAGNASPSRIMDTVNRFASNIGTKIDGMSEKQLGTLAQLGGNMLSGAASGAAAAKTAEEERRFKEEQDAKFRSGSGLTTYGPPSGALAYARAYAPSYRG